MPLSISTDLLARRPLPAEAVRRLRSVYPSIHLQIEKEPKPVARPPHRRDDARERLRKVEATGFEPTTPCVQSRCSPN